MITAAEVSPSVTVAPPLTAQVRRGFQWSFAITLVQGALQIAVTMTMARLLLPHDYGLYATAEVVLRWSTLLAQMGLATVLIQKRRVTDTDLRNAHSLAIALGVGAALVVVAMAPWLGSWFGRPEVVPLLRVASLTFIIGGFGLVSVAMLRRRMEFGRLGAAEVTGYVLGNGLTAILLARQGAGVWAIVIGSLVSQTLQTAIAASQARVGLRIALRLRELGLLLRQGMHVSLNTCLDLTNNTMDAFVVARMLPLPLVGLFNRAGLLASLPANFLWSAVSRVTFPSYARLQDDPQGFLAFMRSVQGWAGTAMVAVPLAMIPAADVIVHFLLGPAWMGAVPIVQLLLLGVAFESLAFPYHIALDALGRYSARTRIRVIIFGLRATTLFLAAWYRTDLLFYVAAVAAVATWLISVQPVARALAAPVGLFFRDDLRILLRALGCAFAVALARYLAGNAGTAAAGTLALCLAAGAATLAYILRHHLRAWRTKT